MPRRPRRRCSWPSCPNTTAGGYCPTHATRLDLARGTASQRGYGTRWQHRRRQYLAGHPTCVRCGGPSQVPDHYPVSRRQLLARGVIDPDADEHLRPLCIPCHNSETAKANRK